MVYTGPCGDQGLTSVMYRVFALIILCPQDLDDIGIDASILREIDNARAAGHTRSPVLGSFMDTFGPVL